MAARVCTGALAGVLLLCAFPGGSWAKCSGTVAPPGNSEVEQYAETVPGSCGNTTPGSSAGPEDVGGSPNGSIPPETLTALEEQGADGQAAAALAAANGPTDSGPVGRKTGPAGGADSPGARPSVQAAEGDSPLAQILGALAGTSDGGVGRLLPMLLLAISIAGAAYLFARRRRIG